MFYHFLYPLREHFSALNIFQYITFRAAMAGMTSLLIAFYIGPKIINMLKKHEVGEIIRTEGPESHFSKKGTPTMGGLIIILSVLIPLLLWANLKNTYIQLIVFVTLWMSGVGFIDDYLKVVKKYKKGLIAKYKLAGQIILGLLLGIYLYISPQFDQVDTLISLPFFKNTYLDIGVFYIPLVVLVITGTSNAVNLTDGLDGLAAGLMGIVAMSFAAISYVSGRVDFSQYLNIIYLKGSGELTVYCLAFAFAMLGFLWYNSKPAQVFMGDTGSLGMGGAIGGLAILMKKEILLFFLGGIFVAEAVSVLIQVGYFRYTRKKYGTGRRVFKMAPLHHHYEMQGMPESKIVIRFWIIGILLALLSISTFKIL
ncbi:MAG: phospho-N-acetylmuramoyl-pentapeptide-transferase [Candidatus Marinimicrobia bacterium]|nr:phospho-N-acetylmuramoyl-pentapeptide-transferase [Candidatus Neomarinimicrobiota bacterium]